LGSSSIDPLCFGVSGQNKAVTRRYRLDRMDMQKTTRLMRNIDAGGETAGSPSRQLLQADRWVFTAAALI